MIYERYSKDADLTMRNNKWLPGEREKEITIFIMVCGGGGSLVHPPPGGLSSNQANDFRLLTVQEEWAYRISKIFKEPSIDWTSSMFGKLRIRKKTEKQTGL